jgi:hypothetical protein
LGVMEQLSPLAVGMPRTRWFPPARSAAWDGPAFTLAHGGAFLA